MVLLLGVEPVLRVVLALLLVVRLRLGLLELLLQWRRRWQWQQVGVVGVLLLLPWIGIALRLPCAGPGTEGADRQALQHVCTRLPRVPRLVTLICTQPPPVRVWLALQHAYAVLVGGR